MKNNLPFINVYKKKNIKSEVITQLLYGDLFKKIKNEGNWIKIKNKLDSYKGFVQKEKFHKNEKYTHKVFKLYANLYSDSNFKSKSRKKLSFASRIKVKYKKKKFYKFDNFWINKNDIKKISYKKKDVFRDISIFLNVKYKWGGKNFNGVDCSGLIQLFLNFNNQFCPRDTKDQIKYFKKKIKIKNIRKNDLIFWKGHVAVAHSKKNLIHAYGPFKKTVKMPINETINRIYKTAKLKVIGIRRID